MAKQNWRARIWTEYELDWREAGLFVRETVQIEIDGFYNLHHLPNSMSKLWDVWYGPVPPMLVQDFIAERRHSLRLMAEQNRALLDENLKRIEGMLKK